MVPKTATSIDKHEQLDYQFFKPQPVSKPRVKTNFK